MGTYPEASIFKPFDDDPESDQSFVEHPVVPPGAAETAAKGYPDGKYGELSPELKDVQLARIAAAERAGEEHGFTAVGHDSSSPAVLETQGRGAFIDSTTLHGLED